MKLLLCQLLFMRRELSWAPSRLVCLISTRRVIFAWCIIHLADKSHNLIFFFCLHFLHGHQMLLCCCLRNQDHHTHTHTLETWTRWRRMHRPAKVIVQLLEEVLSGSKNQCVQHHPLQNQQSSSLWKSVPVHGSSQLDTWREAAQRYKTIKPQKIK